MCSELTRWTVFSLLDPTFGDNIRLAVVFGNSGNEALIVTKDDQVFGFGTNASGCLGLSSGQSSLGPTRVASLCGQSLSSIAFGAGPHLLALNLKGEVFSWGHNAHGQLGNGTTETSSNPCVVAGISGYRVVQIACGSYHSVALTDEGQIYSWGQNNCGQIGICNTQNQLSPRRITGCLSNKRIKYVACSHVSSFAISDCGELFAWGCNVNGQLGLANNQQNQLAPSHVIELSGKIISQVVCGHAHSMALTDEGEVFAWGSNQCGQLGVGNKTNQFLPTRTCLSLGRVSEIAAVHSCNISGACVGHQQVYMWGQCRGLCVLEPQQTRFHCVDDIFACFANPSICCRPFTFSAKTGNKLQESVKIAFDDQLTSDIRFVVEGKPIYVHKALLKIRCYHFRSMLQEGMWNEGEKESIDISHFSYTVYKAFLQYLYTDKLDLVVEDAVMLLDLANSYCEFELKEKCVKLIRCGISVENALVLYAAALRYEAKDLEDFCFQFCFNHLTAVTQTEAFHRLDEQTVKHFIRQASKQGAFKH